MLKKIKDMLPLLVVTPTFILFKCSDETRKRVSEKKLEFKQFDDIGAMEEYIKVNIMREHIEVLSPFINAE